MARPPCRLLKLPADKIIAAAATAAELNPANRPPDDALRALGITAPLHIAMLHSKDWGPKRRTLGVSFLQQTNQPLRDRILQHMNAWFDLGVCIDFRWSQSQGEIRCDRSPGGGYAAFLGPDNLHVPPGEPNLWLEMFTMATSESEYHRVVRHETGHLLGCPHEHERKEIIARLDPAKVIPKFKREQGWTEEEIRQQIFTPPDPRDLIAGPVEERSVMCYEFDGDCTFDGTPIPGGTDITAADAAFMRQRLPLVVAPPTPPITPPVKPPVVPPVTPPIMPTGPIPGGWQAWLTAFLRWLESLSHPANHTPEVQAVFQKHGLASTLATYSAVGRVLAKLAVLLPVVMADLQAGKSYPELLDDMLAALA